MALIKGCTPITEGAPGKYTTTLELSGNQRRGEDTIRRFIYDHFEYDIDEQNPITDKKIELKLSNKRPALIDKKGKKKETYDDEIVIVIETRRPRSPITKAKPKKVGNGESTKQELMKSKTAKKKTGAKKKATKKATKKSS